MRARYGAEKETFTYAPDDSSRLLSHCLSPDIEVGIKDRRIRAFAGLRRTPDNLWRFL